MSPSLTSVSVFLAHDQVFEILRRMQIGVGGQVDLDERTLGAAEGGEKVIARPAPCAPAPG